MVIILGCPFGCLRRCCRAVIVPCSRLRPFGCHRHRAVIFGHCVVLGELCSSTWLPPSSGCRGVGARHRQDGATYQVMSSQHEDTKTHTYTKNNNGHTCRYIIMMSWCRRTSSTSSDEPSAQTDTTSDVHVLADKSNTHMHTVAT